MLPNYVRDRKIEYVKELILETVAVTAVSGIILFIGDVIIGHLT